MTDAADITMIAGLRSELADVRADLIRTREKNAELVEELEVAGEGKQRLLEEIARLSAKIRTMGHYLENGRTLTCGTCRETAFGVCTHLANRGELLEQANANLTEVQKVCTDLSKQVREYRQRGIVLPGWNCTCGCFNGEAKEPLLACRACGVAAPEGSSLEPSSALRSIVGMLDRCRLPAIGSEPWQKAWTELLAYTEPLTHRILPELP